MNYVYYFDIAAIALLLVVLIFFNYRRVVSDLQDYCFLALLVVCLLTTINDLWSALMLANPHPQNKTLLWLSNTFYYFFNMMITPLYAMYILSLTGFFKKNFGKNRYNADRNFKVSILCALIVPFALTELFVLFSALFAKFNLYELVVFYINDEGFYVRGRIPFFMIYVVTFYYCILALMLLLIHRKELKNSGKLMIIFAFYGLSIVGWLMQTAFPQILIQCFCISIGLLVFSYNIQHQNYYIDLESGFFNKKSISEVLKSQFLMRKDFFAIGLVIDDLDFLSNNFGNEQIDSLMKVVTTDIYNMFPKEKIFTISQGRFLIVFNSASLDKKDEAMKKLQTRFSTTWINDNRVVFKLYTRLCWMVCPTDARNSDEMIEILNLVANDASYKRKIIDASQIDLEKVKARQSIENDLLDGVKNDLFQVYYQPIYSIKENRLVGAEALVRLQDKNGDFISPDIFIPIAEKNGTIFKIGQKVLETVCKMLSRLGNPQDYGIQKININLSVCQCMQELMSDLILKTVNSYKIGHDVLNVEITENASVYKQDVILENVEKLRKNGIGVVLDDYGSGSSNLDYLLTLKFQDVKIDKNIIWLSEKDEKMALALKNIINMIKDLGMTVFAKGVETKEQAIWLKELGCDYFQGFYFAKPMNEDQFLALMSSKKNTFEL